MDVEGRHPADAGRRAGVRYARRKRRPAERPPSGDGHLFRQVARANLTWGPVSAGRRVAITAAHRWTHVSKAAQYLTTRIAPGRGRWTRWPRTRAARAYPRAFRQRRQC